MAMQWPLVLSGLGLGLAAIPHCAVMCATPCSAFSQRGRAGSASFQAGRLAGYVAAGALVAYSVSSLGVWRSAAPALRPLWTLVHLGGLFLGLWWLAAGRHPDWLRRDAPVAVLPQGRRQPARRAALAGVAWVAWPCAAMQGALALAALANTAAGGGLVMGAFGLASMPGLLAGPWAWRQWQAWWGKPVDRAALASTAFRIAGSAMVGASAWALGHDLWARLPSWCAG